MSTVEYSSEDIEDVWDEVVALGKESFNEIATFGKGGGTSPSKSIYLMLRDCSLLQLSTARKDGELIGYALFAVATHPHHEGCLHAMCDTLYVRKEHRKGWVAVRLLKHAEEACKQLGAGVMTVSMSVASPFDSLAEYLGYEKVEIVCMKQIGG